MPAELLPDSAGARPLNGAIVVALDGNIDPLSVTSSSVRVERMDGTEFPIAIRSDSGTVRILLVVTDDYFSRHGGGVWLEVAGFPSPSALVTLDGRCLRSTVRRCIVLEPHLGAGSAVPPMVVSVNGTTDWSDPVVVAGTNVVLSFDGVLDPNTVTSVFCPIYPDAGELTLMAPLLPAVTWECVGSRFDVILVIPPASGLLHFILRRCGFRDLSGRPPEPASLSVNLLSM